MLMSSAAKVSMVNNTNCKELYSFSFEFDVYSKEVCTRNHSNNLNYRITRNQQNKNKISIKRILVSFESKMSAKITEIKKLFESKMVEKAYLHELK